MLGNVGVYASPEYTVLALEPSGSIVSLPNTRDTSPNFVCPCLAFVIAILGIGNPPNSSVLLSLSKDKL